MTRDRIVLAGMAAAGPGAKFDAVRLQKLFFLIDREIPHLIGGPHFDYKPYHYGPFDKAVYDVLDDLLESGDAAADASSRYPLYSLTDSGTAKGTRFPGRVARQCVPLHERGRHLDNGNALPVSPGGNLSAIPRYGPKQRRTPLGQTIRSSHVPLPNAFVRLWNGPGI